MYFEAVFSFYVLLYHFVGHSFFGLIAFGSFSDIIKRNFSLTLTKLNFYVDMSVWLFVGKQYYRLHVPRLREQVYRAEFGGAPARRVKAATSRARVSGSQLT